MQSGARTRDLLAEIAESQLDGVSRLRIGDDRNRLEVFVAAEHVLGEVQACAREPLGARHLARAEHALVRRVRADLEEVPDRCPERLEVGDGPLPELLVAGELESALGGKPLEVATEDEPLPGVLGRRPEHLALFERPVEACAHGSDPRAADEIGFLEAKTPASEGGDG